MMKTNRRSAISKMAIAVTVIIVIVVAAVSVAGTYYTIKPSTVTVTSTAAPTTVTSTAAPTTVTSTAAPTTVTSTAFTTAPVITLGLDLGLTGPYGAPSSDVLWGVNYVINQTNAEGGIYLTSCNCNATIKLTVLDDTSVPQVGVTNTERLITVDHVNFLLGSFGAALVDADATVAQKYSTLMVTAGSGDSVLDNMSWIFVNWINLNGQTQPFVNFIKSLPASEQAQCTKIAIFAEQSSLGADTAANWKAGFTAAGFDVVYEGSYASGATDYSSLILGAKAAGANALFAIPVGPDGLTLVKQMNSLGWSPALIDMQRAAETPEFASGLGTLANGMMDVNPWVSTLNNTLTTKAVAAYEAQHGGAQPSNNVGGGLVNTEVMLEAIQKAGSLNETLVRAQLQHDTFTTASGPVSFPNGMGHDQSNLYIFQWQNGVTQIIYPYSYATAAVVFPFVWNQG